MSTYFDDGFYRRLRSEKTKLRIASRRHIYDDGMPSYGEVEASFDLLPNDAGEEDERLAYLKFLRDVVLPRSGGGANCHKFPEYGYVTDETIVDHIIQRENEIQERKENEMGTMDASFYRREAERLLERAAILDTLPQSDTFDNSQIVTFNKVYNGITYCHAAIKAVGYWYITGNRAPQKVTWDALIEFIGFPNLHSLDIVTQAVPVAEYVKAMQQALEAGDE